MQILWSFVNKGFPYAILQRGFHLIIRKGALMFNASRSDAGLKPKSQDQDFCLTDFIFIHEIYLQNKYTHTESNSLLDQMVQKTFPMLLMENAMHCRVFNLVVFFFYYFKQKSCV